MFWNRNTESHGVLNFFGHGILKIINCSTLTCVEAALVYGVIKLFSGIYSKLIKVLVHKKQLQVKHFKVRFFVQMYIRGM